MAKYEISVCDFCKENLRAVVHLICDSTEYDSCTECLKKGFIVDYGRPDPYTYKWPHDRLILNGKDNHPK